MKEKILKFLDSPEVFAIGLGLLTSALIWGLVKEFALQRSFSSGDSPSRQHYINSTNGF